MNVVALHLYCEACGATVRVDRDDRDTFCAFWAIHYLPTVDEALLADGSRIEVVTR